MCQNWVENSRYKSLILDCMAKKTLICWNLWFDSPGRQATYKLSIHGFVVHNCIEMISSSSSTFWVVVVVICARVWVFGLWIWWFVSIWLVRKCERVKKLYFLMVSCICLVDEKVIESERKIWFLLVVCIGLALWKVSEIYICIYVYIYMKDFFI